MIVLDASVLIAHLDSHDLHHEKAVALLNANPAEELSASVLTIAEVLVGPARAGVLDRALTALEQLGLTGVEITENAATRLALLSAETGMKIPDCCVVLAAEESGAGLGTFDLQLALIAQDREIAGWIPALCMYSIM